MTTTTSYRAASRRHKEELERTLEALKRDLSVLDTDPEIQQRWRPEAIQHRKQELTAAARTKALASAKQAMTSTAEWVDALDGRIGQARMAAASATDWNELSVRAREFDAMLSIESNVLAKQSPARVAARLRDEMAAQGDAAGLRALRMSVRPQLANWRRDESQRRYAMELANVFEQDEIASVPGLDELLQEKQAAEEARMEAHRAVELAAREFELDEYRQRFQSGTRTTRFEREAMGASANLIFPESESAPREPQGANVNKVFPMPGEGA